MFREPQTVGRYEVRGQVGVGGFATVYRAYDPVLDREVALKVLHSHLARDPVFRERFVREGRALARVMHPNVVQAFDAGEVDGTAYLAMQLVVGRSLDAILHERGPLPLVEILSVTKDIAGALAALHARHLVHRDIKPDNILIEQNSGRPVLLDLGIARVLDATVMTTPGWLLGTLAFMAPEQLQQGGLVTPQTDVYQLGATVYTLLAGRPLFEGDQLAVLDAVRHDAPPHLADLRPDLPPGVAAVVMEALDKDPALRPEGTQQFAARLQAAAMPDPTHSLPSRQPAPPGVSPSPEGMTTHPQALPTGGRNIWRAWPWLAGVGALVLVVLGVGLLGTRGGDEGAAPTPLTEALPSPTPTQPTVPDAQVTLLTTLTTPLADPAASPDPCPLRASPACATLTTPLTDPVAGIAADSAGNVYFVGQARIGKISPDRTVTTLVGSGTQGFADGLGSAAQFQYPKGMAVDAAGNVYVADSGNERVRKVSPDGRVTTLAGSGISSFADGTGTSAHFWNPESVAVDLAGNVYVVDAGNARIRKITPDGKITRFADAVQFERPVGVAVDAAGSIYVLDSGSIDLMAANGRIVKITPAGMTMARARIPGVSAPYYFAVDAAGNSYIRPFLGPRI